MKTATEAGFLATVIEYAKLRGWLVHHQRPAMTKRGWRSAIQGDAGLPDLVMVRDDRVVFAELKMPLGKLSAMQTEWMWRLTRANVEFYLWTPDNWATIENVLR